MNMFNKTKDGALSAITEDDRTAMSGENPSIVIKQQDIDGNFYNMKSNNTLNILTYEKGIEDFVLSCSSGRFRDEDVNKWLGDNTNYGSRKPKKKKLVIVIYHPNSVTENKWDNVVHQKKKEIKYLAILAGVEFVGFRYMDTE